jgi:hypothetical protein
MFRDVLSECRGAGRVGQKNRPLGRGERGVVGGTTCRGGRLVFCSQVAGRQIELDAFSSSEKSRNSPRLSSQGARCASFQT